MFFIDKFKKTGSSAVNNCARFITASIQNKSVFLNRFAQVKPDWRLSCLRNQSLPMFFFDNIGDEFWFIGICSLTGDKPR